MPETPAPLDLDALATAEAEAKHYRAQRDEWFLMESRAREAAEAEVVLLRTRIRKARHQRDEARAEVARLTTRPAPVWDEDAVRADALDAVTTTGRMVLAGVPGASADVIARNVTRALLARFTITPKEDR